MIRKNFLLMLALTLLVCAGQVSAQGPSLSLRHVPDAGGTEGTVSGQGTTFTVRISQTGVNDVPGISNAAGLNIDFVFDASKVSLTAAPGLLTGTLEGGIRLTLLALPGQPLTLPPSVDLTFTTVVDVTDMEFSIEITGVSSTGIAIPLSEKLTFNSVRPPPLPINPQLHLDTQIENPAQNNSVQIFKDKRPGDTLQIQLFVPSAAGTDIQAFTLELALQGKTFANFISSISGSDWMGGDLFPGTSASDNPTLSGLFLNAAPVPMTGYLGQIDLKVAGVLSDQDKLRVTSAFLAVAGGTLQSVDVSNAEVSFTSVYICPGDFDDNGIVNMADFLLFGEVFGTRSGDAAYNALMDMDSSGGIDVADFLLFVDVFDTTCEKQSPGGGGGGGQTGVSIPDANLRTVIADSLSKASDEPITPSEMASLTRLYATESEISNLTGLEYATGLTVLSLGSNSITDLSALSKLTNLTLLGLRNNNISDVSALSNLINLRVLSLRNNNISDLSPLVANTGLGSGDGVDVRENPLSATSITMHIPTLQNRGVNVQFDAPQSVSIPDANLRAVIEDSLGKASGAPITPSEMASLTRLEAPNSEISDLTGLEFAAGLTRLDLGHEVVDNTIVNSNSISDISPLSNLNSLTWLNLSFNSISDVSALSNLTNLTSLSLYGNSISDISSLSGLTSLAWLELSGNKISTITPLSGLTGLTNLYLRFNSISDISPLSSLTNLRVLWLRQNKISDISSLSSLTNLTSLFLNSNEISDITPLSGLTNLDWLVLNSNKISDISSLSSLTNLRGLFLDGNQLTGSIPSWLGSLTNLQRLALSDNAGLSGPLPDSFTSLASLQYLYLAGTGLCAPTDAAFQAWLEGIENKSGVVDCGDGDTPKIYWTERSLRKIQRANLDGSNVEDLVVELEPISIALDVDGSKIYWTDIRTDKIQRSNLDGSNVEDLVALEVSNSSGPWNIALDVDGGKIYWTYRTSGTEDKIQRSNLDGSNVEDLITTGLHYINGIALDVSRDKMYWVDEGTGKIQRSNLDGSNVEDLITTGLSRPWGIALDVSRDKMYWADQGTGKIQRSNLDGSNVEDLITGLGKPIDIALDVGSGKMYWMATSGSGATKIQRSNLDGSNVEDLITGLGNLWGIALDTSGRISGGNGSTSVTIPDANLRAVIEDSLSKARGAPITQAEMASLTRLEAQNKNIRDLTGLEYAINLTWLDLSEEQVSSNTTANSNSFSDLSPLANLTRLTWLDLSYNDNISDISSLSGLTNLTHLNLSTNWAISDFSTLSGLTNLTELYLFGISDVSVLSGLTNLTTLSINSTDISDISPLSGLTNLTELYLRGPSTIGTDISDLSSLSGLANLTKLSLSGHKISDISSLSGLTNLTELYFSFAPISDISSLSGLTGLTRLGFHVSNISDISSLSGLTNLTWLNFTFGDFSDISSLSGLTNLTYVRLIHCRISDLAPLVANTGLGDGDEVNVENNPLSATSRNTHIPALQTRGVNVRF